MLSQLVYLFIFSTLSADNLEHYRICSHIFSKTISFKYPLINYHGSGNVLMLIKCVFDSIHFQKKICASQVIGKPLPFSCFGVNLPPQKNVC